MHTYSTASVCVQHATLGMWSKQTQLWSHCWATSLRQRTCATSRSTSSATVHCGLTTACVQWRPAASASVMTQRCRQHGRRMRRQAAKAAVRFQLSFMAATLSHVHVVVRACQVLSTKCTAAPYRNTSCICKACMLVNYCNRCALQFGLLCAVTAAEEESAVNRSIDAQHEEQLRSLRGWKGLDNPWLPAGDADIDFSYINLLANPERYTGYMVSSCPPGMMFAAVMVVPASAAAPAMCAAKIASVCGVGT